jgi:hypothetical protein
MTSLLTVHSEFDQDAHHALSLLRQKMEQVMQTNEDMRRRLSRIESSQTHSMSSGSFINDDHSTVRDLDLDAKLPASPENLFKIPFRGSNIVENVSAFNRSLEKLLETSRAYQRPQLSQCDVSFSSSNIPSHAWSALSGVSLADISMISVLALPLERNEVSKLLSSSLKSASLHAPSTSTQTLSPPVTELYKIRKARKIDKRTARRLTLKSKDFSEWPPGDWGRCSYARVAE